MDRRDKKGLEKKQKTAEIRFLPVTKWTELSHLEMSEETPLKLDGSTGFAISPRSVMVHLLSRIDLQAPDFTQSHMAHVEVAQCTLSYLLASEEPFGLKSKALKHQSSTHSLITI